jgi:hypothetical protein
MEPHGSPHLDSGTNEQRGSGEQFRAYEKHQGKRSGARRLITAGLYCQNPESRIRALLFRQRGACLVSQQADLIRWHPSRTEEPVRRLPARQAHPLPGRRHAGGNPVGLAGGRADRPRPGAGARAEHQIRHQAGGRLLSNQGIDVDTLLAYWVPFIVGSRPEIAVALDWTDFDADGQTTLMLSLLTRHGRATPLYWLTVDTNTLKGRRNQYEYQVLVRFAAALPDEVKLTVLADRGFCDHKLYRVLRDELKFSFVIRMRANIMVSAASGERRKAADWVSPGGRARVLHGATVTGLNYPVGTVVCVHAKDMKEPSRAPRVLPPEDRFAMVPGHRHHRQDRARTDEPVREALGCRMPIPGQQGHPLRQGHG